jgi:cytochrome c
MPAHPGIRHAEAAALAARILETEPEADSTDPRAEALPDVAWTYDADVGPRPASLHPALSSTPIDPPGLAPRFTPQVGGLAWLPDGRLAVATWDRDGAVFVVSNGQGPAAAVRIERIAEGLHEPLGLAFAEGALHVMQKQEITRLVDHDGDGWTDEYRTLTNDWGATSNFHEFGFGLAAVEGDLVAALSVCILAGGKSCPGSDGRARQGAARLARDGRGRDRRRRAADAERGRGGPERGDLRHRQPGRLAAGEQAAAHRARRHTTVGAPRKRSRTRRRRRRPARRPRPRRSPRSRRRRSGCPHNEVGNSPTQPVVLQHGPYAGQILFGDVLQRRPQAGRTRARRRSLAGGRRSISRAGCRRRCTASSRARKGASSPARSGVRGNWGEFGKPWYGLEMAALSRTSPRSRADAGRAAAGRLRRGAEPAARRRSRARREALPGRGLVLRAEPAIRRARNTTSASTRSAACASPPIARVVSLELAGLEAGRVVYLRLDPAIRSERGERLWVDEAWYTLNALPEAGAPSGALADAPTADASAPSEPSAAPNTLSAAEQAQGWRLLFDGETFAGWKNYGAADDAIEGWVVRDGALEFTRIVSFAGLVWNHLNPFGTAALDLMTKERFSDFELTPRMEGRAGRQQRDLLSRSRRDGCPRPGRARSRCRSSTTRPTPMAPGTSGAPGDLYDVVASRSRASRPAGEWNAARIRVAGDRIEHWLNGEPIVSIERGSPRMDPGRRRQQARRRRGLRRRPERTHPAPGSRQRGLVPERQDPLARTVNGLPRSVESTGRVSGR